MYHSVVQDTLSAYMTWEQWTGKRAGKIKIRHKSHLMTAGRICLLGERVSLPCEIPLPRPFLLLFPMSILSNYFTLKGMGIADTVSIYSAQHIGTGKRIEYLYHFDNSDFITIWLEFDLLVHTIVQI